MTAPPYRAFRFVHPDLDAPRAIAGLRVSASGGTAMVDGQRSVRQAIMLLLTTVPGERVRRPSYGCELHRLVFSPNDDTTAGLAIHFVRQALRRWEPRIDVLKLDAIRSNGSPEKLEILLEYRVKMTGQIDTLVHLLDLVSERVS